MLVIALVLALIGLAALVFAVVTSNVLVAWVCIGASVLGVLLLIVDALRERRLRDTADQAPGTAEAAEPPEAADVKATETGASDPEDQRAEDYPDEAPHEGAEAAPDALDDGEPQVPAAETTQEPVESVEPVEPTE